MVRSLVVPAALVCGLLLSAAPARADEPAFNGRKLSEWVTMLKEDPTPRKRRAAVVALGQLAAGGERDAVAATLAQLGKALRNDANATVRRQAAATLGQLKAETLAAALGDLTDAMRAERDPAVRREVATALARLGEVAKPAVGPLTAALKDTDAPVRAAAADALGRIGGEAKGAAPELLPLLKDADTSVRQAAIFALGRVKPDDTITPAAALISVLKTDPDVAMRHEAILSLGLLGDRSQAVIAALGAALADKDAELRALAALTLGKFGPAIHTVEAQLLKAMASDPDKGVRLNAVRTLVSGFGTDAPQLIPALTKQLRADTDFEVRVAIVEELGGMGSAGKPAVPALRIAQKDPQVKVREAAAAALKNINRPKFQPK
jgi:HEAT repeat protein